MKKVTFLLAFLALFGMTVTTVALARDGSDDGDDDDSVEVKTSLTVKTSDDNDADEVEDANDDADGSNSGKGSANSGKGSVSSGKTTATADLLEKTKLRATAELDRRIGKLEDLSDRADDLRRIDENTKASINATIDAQIKALTDLKAKIAAETDGKTIKEDIKTIVDTHKVFTLVMPKAAIIATADKIKAAADLMSGFTAKLQARIDEITTGDTTALKAALTDFTAKLADAKTQAEAAVTLTGTMKADDGTQATYQANVKILQQARVDLKKAREDLRIARQDAEKIVNGVKGKHTGEDKPKTEVKTETETEVEND